MHEEEIRLTSMLCQDRYQQPLKWTLRIRGRVSCGKRVGATRWFIKDDFFLGDSRGFFAFPQDTSFAYISMTSKSNRTIPEPSRPVYLVLD